MPSNFRIASLKQKCQKKGLSIKEARSGVFIVTMDDGETYVPRDLIDLEQFVNDYKAPVVRPPADTDTANQILDHTPRA